MENVMIDDNSAVVLYHKNPLIPAIIEFDTINPRISV